MAYFTPVRGTFNGSPVDLFPTGQKTGYQSSVPLVDVINANKSGMRICVGISFSANLGVAEAVEIKMDYRVVDCGSTFGSWRTVGVVLRSTNVVKDNIYRLELRIPSDDVAGMDKGFLEFSFFRIGTGTDNYPGTLHVHYILPFEDDTPNNDTPAYFLCGTAL